MYHLSARVSKLQSSPMEIRHLSYFIFLLCASSVREGNATIFKGEMEFAGGILNFANFAQFLNHKLNATVMESRTVVNDEECILACTESINCRSLNIKITPDANRKYTCQILDTDKFVSHHLFAASSEFHHYSCTAPCENNPCNNGGTCFPSSDWRDFKCDCPPSVQGRTCEEVPYKDCAELLTAGIRLTGMHAIIDKNWKLLTYCDQEFLGGGWTMVFKMPSSNLKSIQESWSSLSPGINQNNAELMNVGTSNKQYYASRRIKNWSSLKPKEVRVALYQDEKEVLSLVFNATDSDKKNWFSKSRLTYSPWTDLESEQQNYFSLIGDLASERAFYINKVNESCDGDAGWLMASGGKLCDYELRHLTPKTFIYSKIGTSVNWNDHENVGIADVLMVFIR